MKRFSVKRQCILECIASSCEHPSADMVYTNLRKQFPTISLATVYRNIKSLEEDGFIRSVGIVNGHERYDIHIEPHTHVFCIRCGKVSDAFEVVLPDFVKSAVEHATGYTVKMAELNIKGICEECRNAENHES